MAVADIPKLDMGVHRRALYPVVGEANISMDGRSYHVYVAGIDPSMRAIGLCSSTPTEGVIVPTFYWLECIDQYVPT